MHWQKFQNLVVLPQYGEVSYKCSVCGAMAAVYMNKARKNGSISGSGTNVHIDTSAMPPRQACTLELCAGIVDKDVSIEEIARQELLEEVGYDVPVSKLEKIVSSRFSVFFHLFHESINQSYSFICYHANLNKNTEV